MTEKYGAVLFLKLGTRKVLVVSSLPAIEECFTRNDIVFANRPRTLAGKHLNYNHKTMGFSNYGDHWRNLRRLTTPELFTTNRLAMFSAVRLEEVQLLVKQLFLDSSSGTLAKVKLNQKLVELVFNIMMKMMAGKGYYGNDAVDQEAKEFQNIMRDVAELLGSSNLNDFLPVLQWIDFQGVEKRMIKLKNKMDSFFQNLVDEHRRTGKDSSGSSSRIDKKMTLIDVMLSSQETDPIFFNDETIKGVILAMLLAGTDTTVTTIEWAMSVLLNHPDAMLKVWVEISANAGLDRLVDEQDLPNLVYLHSVINETFRLFPTVPLLVPHESSDDCTVCGFDIPRGTMLLVNTWTFHRDPKLRDDAWSFMPERFESSEVEGCKLLPFGAGWRACPGAVLGRLVIGLALGSLIQSFECDRIGPDLIDLSEGTGLTMPKAQPLEALCKPRQTMIPILSEP